MARITVEDCIMRVPNRFELVLLAAQRARELTKGKLPTVALENDKSHVIALREIADGTIDPSNIKVILENAILGLNQEDEPLDEFEEAGLDMEGPAQKIDYDRIARGWEVRDAAMNDEGPRDKEANPDGIDVEPNEIDDSFDGFIEPESDDGGDESSLD